MRIVASCAELREALAAPRVRGLRIAFVPTMGNLHEGHLELVRRARMLADLSVVSLFVNPFQFGEGEDYLGYPRTLESDLEHLRELAVDCLFLPETEALYPEGLERVTRVEVPELGEILCGRFRPHFFRGVCTVVNMLFNLVGPSVAVFGEKDYQQLVLVRRMVRDLKMPIAIESVPTVRERDGLAMSSRNLYLSDEERGRAPHLYRVLGAAAERGAAGERDLAAIEQEAVRALEARGFRPDYVSARRADDLAPPAPDDTRLVVLAAAWLGRARLIDNVAVNRGRA